MKQRVEQRRRQSEVVAVSEVVRGGVGRRVVEERLHRRVGGRRSRKRVPLARRETTTSSL